MNEKRRKRVVAAAAIAIAAAAFLAGLFAFRAATYQRPCRTVVERSGVEPALVYAVIKAESGFDENAVSSAGAVGLMQLLPATAEFICMENGIRFESGRLAEGEYNTTLGCLYLRYLLTKFEEETALAAYNAGEGTVSGWLKNEEFSPDGKKLLRIPYPETARYLKKVIKFRKNYRFFYH